MNGYLRNTLIVIIALGSLLQANYAQAAVRIEGDSTTYSSIQQAYDNAQDQDTLQVQSMWYSENCNFNRDISIILTGGYNQDFSNNNLDDSVIVGDLNITSGEATIDKLIIATIDTNPPGSPTGLAPVAGDSLVILNWTANSELDLEGYNVYRSQTSGSGYIKVNTSLVTQAFYYDYGLTNGNTYYYVITAVDGSINESQYSDEVNSTPTASTGPTSVGGTISSDTTWTYGQSPYIVTKSFVVNNGATLTIEPGVEIRFNGNYNISINSATLNAIGTVSQPITFTSNQTTPAKGDWGYIRAYSNNSEINFNNCIIEYGGSTDAAVYGYLGSSGSSVNIQNTAIRHNLNNGIECFNTPAVIQNCSITDNADYGIYCESNTASVIIEDNNISDNGSYPISIRAQNLNGLSGNTFSNNSINAIKVSGQTWSNDLIFRNEGVPYVVTSYITVNGAILTIEPGVEISFTSSDCYLSVNNSAVLNAIGTASEPITFTSNQTTPAPGDWKYVGISSNSTATIKNCIIEYGGSTSGAVYCSQNNGFSVNIQNTAIRHNSNSGIYLYTTEALIKNCNITDNASYGIDSNGFSLVDARLNWWGSDDEPLGEIDGDATYGPWLGAEFTQPFTFNKFYASSDKFSQAGGWTVFTVFISEEANWNITITDDTDQVVRTFSGSGDTINQEWYGDDDNSSALSDGIYTYKIEAASISSTQASAPLIGKIELQADAPVAKITTPVNDDILTGNIDIIGTATDSNFTSYTVECGKGAFPASWEEIATSSTAVDNNLLATWNSATDSYLNGTYSIRLTVEDTNGNVSIDTKVVELNNIQITDVSLSSIAFDPLAEETTNISYVLSVDADVTVGIYAEATNNLVRTLLNSQPQSAGTHNVDWDGQDDLSALLPMDAYYFVITAEDSNGRFGGYNNASSPVDDPLFNQNTDADDWDFNPKTLNPYENDTVELTWYLSVPARMSVEIKIDASHIIKTVSNLKPYPAGNNLELWDGRDDNGNIYNGVFKAYWGVPQILPRDVIITRNTTFNVTNVSTESYLIVPANSQISTIYYTLTKNSIVTMEIDDPNGNYFTTIISDTAQNAGSYNIEWDGTNASGNLCFIEGDYRVNITAKDPGSNYEITRTATILVYKD